MSITPNLKIGEIKKTNNLMLDSDTPAEVTNTNGKQGWRTMLSSVAHQSINSTPKLGHNDNISMTDSTSTLKDSTLPFDHRPLTDVCFENFSLHPQLLQGLERSGFIRCTPIQAMSLPLALMGKDVTGQAQTGTGKTAAFLVVVFNRLLTQAARIERKSNDPRAVILAPTRELAIQIEKDARAIAKDTGLSLALIYGGVDYDKQRELLQRGADIIIATPGRLIDFVKQHVISLSAVDIVVLDEADRMFDLGFIKDIRFLLRRMPSREQRQCLLFSATLGHRVLELAYEHMNNPEKLVVEQETVTAARVRQRVYFPANEEKIPLLIGLLARMDAKRTMVFVNTKAWVERVAKALERAHFLVGVLSGDVPQKKREQLLGKFQRGDLEILVVTDVAARGLHIPGITHVFNFDLPFDAEDYVHRIGRTARLGAEGDAVSFACELYATSLPDIERFIDQKIPVEQVEAALLEPVIRSAPTVSSSVDSMSDIFAQSAAKPKSRGRQSPNRKDNSRSHRSAKPVAFKAAHSSESSVMHKKPNRQRYREKTSGPMIQTDVVAVPSVVSESLVGRIKLKIKGWMNRLPGRNRHR